MPWIKNGDDYYYESEDASALKLREELQGESTEYQRAADWRNERFNLQRWITLALYRLAVFFRKLRNRDGFSDSCPHHTENIWGEAAREAAKAESVTSAIQRLRDRDGKTENRTNP